VAGAGGAVAERLGFGRLCATPDRDASAAARPLTRPSATRSPQAGQGEHWGVRRRRRVCRGNSPVYSRDAAVSSANALVDPANALVRAADALVNSGDALVDSPDALMESRDALVDSRDALVVVLNVRVSAGGQRVSV
jgi:hypothetical protein